MADQRRQPGGHEARPAAHVGHRHLGAQIGVGDGRLAHFLLKVAGAQGVPLIGDTLEIGRGCSSHVHSCHLSLFQVQLDSGRRTTIRQPTLDLVFEPAHPVRIDAIARRRTLDLAPDQSRFPEHLQMLADGGLRQRRRLHDLVGHALPVLGQRLHDLETDGVAERLQHGSQTLELEL